jgi:predicted RNase H-like HicB family nuclease
MIKRGEMMTFDVLVLKQPDNGYIARPVFWPDAIAHGATEQEAIAGVQTLIRDLLEQVQVVKVEVDIPSNEPENLWLTKAGAFAEDPTWDDFLEKLAEYRKQVTD